MARPDEYDQAVMAINSTGDLFGQVMHMGGGIEAIEVIHQGVTVIVSGSDAQVFADGLYYVTIEGSSDSYQETTTDPGRLPELIREAVRVHSSDVDLVAEILEQQYGWDVEVHLTGGGVYSAEVNRDGVAWSVYVGGDVIAVVRENEEEAATVSTIAELVRRIVAH